MWTVLQIQYTLLLSFFTMSSAHNAKCILGLAVQFELSQVLVMQEQHVRQLIRNCITSTILLIDEKLQPLQIHFTSAFIADQDNYCWCWILISYPSNLCLYILILFQTSFKYIIILPIIQKWKQFTNVVISSKYSTITTWYTTILLVINNQTATV